MKKTGIDHRFILDTYQPYVQCHIKSALVKHLTVSLYTVGCYGKSVQFVCRIHEVCKNGVSYGMF